MRLDKFLKTARIIKRRTVAKDFALSERIMINGRVAKPSSLVKAGDIVTLRIGERQMVFEILAVKENIKASEAKELYREIV
ncbi:MAG TPA: RNA-binding S4 domain-containing protein [Syntrophomonadaceae bacterium]|nr:RNA-binding S4 domain-containing protein [Syntrophomonadaceae bacterium]HNX28856.1 RNA-binding S4 domain-containing protein [Syntrophomonadaceae bacterium]HPR93276.1 RNA-binding S4 domain-containing protein [Syntrophomonadaceae bacterium]